MACTTSRTPAGDVRDPDHRPNGRTLLPAIILDNVRLFQVTELPQYLSLMEHMHEKDLLEHGSCCPKNSLIPQPNRGFTCNRGMLAAAFERGEVYSLCVDVPDDEYKRRGEISQILKNEVEEGVMVSATCGPACSTNMFYTSKPGVATWRFLLPALVWCTNNEPEPGNIAIFWVGPEVRRQGLGRTMLRLLRNRVQVGRVDRSLAGTSGFWKKLQTEGALEGVVVCS